MNVCNLNIWCNVIQIHQLALNVGDDDLNSSYLLRIYFIA